MIQNQTILVISPEPWGTNFVSKHHYASELSKLGNYVYFLNPPSSKNAIKNVTDRLFIVDYKIKYRGLSRMPATLSAQLIRKDINRIEKLCGIIFDIIWNFDSSRFFNLKLVDSKVRINHIVDYSENKNIELINTTADLCLSTTDYILQRQKKYNTRSFNLGHGLAQSAEDELVELPISDGLKVGYLGNLIIKYLDWDLIYKLVYKYPEVSFYFAGPYEKSNLSKSGETPPSLQEIMKISNTHFLGSINAPQIQSFLSQMDVLLLPYDAEQYKEQLANPHKVLEYLASGKVIISSWTEEYKNKNHLIEMVKDNSQLLVRFEEVVNNIDVYNNPDKQSLRISYAKKNTYQKKIERIEKLLSSFQNE